MSTNLPDTDTLPHNQFLVGRTALVTGGCSGIGLATAHQLARYGATVAIGSRINNRDPNEISKLHEALSVYGQTVVIAQLDVCDTESVDAYLSQIQAQVGSVDILVNSAGVTAEQGVIGHSEQIWHRVIDTNLTGAFRMTRATLPSMVEQGWGRIINIGSTAATVGAKDNPAYCASKSGLLGLTRCVALEGAPHGVSCVMISPTWVETDLMRTDVEVIATREGRGRSASELTDEIVAQNPQNRIIQPNEVAATAVFLCRDEAFGLSMDNIQITGGALW